MFFKLYRYFLINSIIFINNEFIAILYMIKYPRKYSINIFIFQLAIRLREIIK